MARALRNRTLLVCALMLQLSGCVVPVESPLSLPTQTPEILAKIPFATIDLWPPDLDGSFPTFLGEVGITQPSSNGQSLDVSVLGPQVALVTQSNTYPDLVRALPLETQAAIRSADYQQFLTLVYWYGGTGPGVWSVVENLYLDEVGIRVAIETWLPAETGMQATVMENPYHVIKFDRNFLSQADRGQSVEVRLDESRNLIPTESFSSN